MSPSESFCFCLIFIPQFYRVRRLMSTQAPEVGAAVVTRLKAKAQQALMAALVQLW